MRNKTKMRLRAFLPALRRLFAVLLWLGIWEIASLLVAKEYLIPSPAATLVRLLALLGEEGFFATVLTSLARILCGTAIGVSLGTLLGILSGFLPDAGTILAPLVTVIKATPVASFILLVLLWVKTGQVPVVISALMVLPIVYANVRTGVMKTDPQLREAALLYRLSPLKKAKLLYIPQAAPYFKSALLSAMGLAWKAGIAAEVICLPKKSIGIHLYESKLYLETTDLFAWTSVMILLSILLEGIVKLLLKRLIRENGKEIK